MKRISLYFSRLLLSIILVSCMHGISNASIKDIETAIIQQDYDQAKQVAKQLLSSNIEASEKSEVRYYLGLCELRLSNFDEARSIFTELTKKKHASQIRDKAYLGLFDVYYIDENYKKAHRSVNRLMKVSPKSEFLSLIYLKAARANLKLARWKEAKKYLTKITTNFPNSLEVHTAKQLLNEKQYFSVQVGAFIDRKRAEMLSEELQQKGEYAYIVETIDQEKTIFYRVRVGQLILLDKAQQLKAKLSKEGYPTQIYP